MLALCVWCVYLGDRVLDALRPRTAGWEPTRKTFYRKHLRSASIAVLCLLGAVLPLAYCLLQRSTFYAGLLLAVPLLSYLTFVHLAPVRWRARWPREMVVACVFTLGVFLAIWIGNGRNIYSLWAPALLFAFLCWANCCAIETWEWQENIPYLEGEPSGSTCWAARHLPLLALSIACSAGLAGRMALAPPDFSVAAFLSGVTLFALALCRSRLSMDGLRVAADLALCTPVLVFFLSFL